MKVLLTGGTGFVGSWLVQTAPCEVEALGRNGVPRSTDYTHVIHAAVAYDMATDMRLAARTFNFADTIGAHVLFLSSGAARNPVDDYGLTKATIEAECRAHGYGIARLFAFVGERVNPWLAPYQFARQAIDTGVVRVSGTGNTIRSYLYAEDMARAIWDHVDERGMCEIGSSLPCTIATLAGMVARHTGARVVIEGGDDGPRPVYLPRFGIDPTVSTDEGVRRLVAWLT